MTSARAQTPLVGVDLVRVQDVADAIETFGTRYLDRVFTAAEQADSTGEPRVRAERLAARLEHVSDLRSWPGSRRQAHADTSRASTNGATRARSATPLGTHRDRRPATAAQDRPTGTSGPRSVT